MLPGEQSHDLTGRFKACFLWPRTQVLQLHWPTQSHFKQSGIFDRLFLLLLLLLDVLGGVISLSDNSDTMGGTSPNSFFNSSFVLPFSFCLTSEDEDVVVVVVLSVRAATSSLISFCDRQVFALDICTEIVLQLALHEAESSLEEGFCCSDILLDESPIYFSLAFGVVLCIVATDLHGALQVTDASFEERLLPDFFFLPTDLSEALQETTLLWLTSFGIPPGTALVRQGALQVTDTSLEDCSGVENLEIVTDFEDFALSLVDKSC